MQCRRKRSSFGAKEVYAASLHCYSCVNCTGIDEDITDIVDCESGEVVVGGKTRETKQEHNGTASSMNFTVINLHEPGRTDEVDEVSEYYCVKIVSAEKDVSRTCWVVSKNNKDPCIDYVKFVTEVRSCVTCKTDLCNDVSKNNSCMWYFIILCYVI
ncbi:unnamed protein product, partial [Callosobruchus maculatus]